MKKTRKMSKKRIFWLWFPLFFNICTFVLALINVFNDSKLLNSLVWAMIYLVPWLLFIQARLEARERWNDWLREARRVLDYLEAHGRILLMIHGIKDEQIKTELMEEYKTIYKECILEDEEDEASEL